MDQQELTLVQQAQRGDAHAVGLLWDRLTPKLFGYLINTTRNTALAEDILQTTWLKAIDALPKFEAREAGFSSWLFAIARNECRQHWRKGKGEVVFDPVEHDVADDGHHELQNNILISEVLNLLSEEDRELLRLRYIAEFSTKEIAQILNISSIAARVRLHRAMSRARNLLVSKKHD